MPRTISQRLAIATLGAMVLSLPVLGIAAKRATEHALNSPLDWMPLTFPARAEYERFRRMFEGGDVVVACWPGSTLDDPRVERLVTRLDTRSLDRAGEAAWFERIISGGRTVAMMTGEPLGLARDEAIARLRGSLVGPDGQTTCAFIVFTAEGLRQRGEAVEFIRATLEQECGVPRDDQHLAGPIIDGLSVDVAGHEALAKFAVPAGCAIVLLGWWCLRSLPTTILVVGSALYCVLLDLALVHYCGDTLNALLAVMPPLVLVLGMSGGIHLVNYLYDARAHGGESSLARRAVAMGWLPCILSSGTTALGMASLLVSDVLPVRQFGFYSAAGIMSTFFVLFAVLPGAFELWPRLAEAKSSSDASADEHGPGGGVRRRPGRRRAAAAIVGISVGGMIVAAWAVPDLTTSVRIQTLFGQRSRILADYAWIEQRLAPLVPIEVVVRFAADNPLDVIKRLELVAEIERRLKTLPEVGGTMSARTFLPTPDSSKSAGAVAWRTIFRRKLEKHRDELVRLRYLHDEGGTESWRITARVSALEDIDYGSLLGRVAEVVEPAIAALPEPDRRGTTAMYTGIMPLVHDIQRALLDDLFYSFLTACATITAVMMLAVRGVAAGLVAMIPNVFPMALLFGALGWLRVPMDIGSVMTASVALGMAVDGTLHFLTFYRRAQREGFDPDDSVDRAYDHCAGALLQSTVVCSLGLAVFSLSEFLPTSRFSIVLVALMWLALFGDMVQLPALLQTPLNRFFRR